MRLGWRELARHETDHELIWLTISVAAFIMAAVWLALGLPWPQCLFLAVTGHPCITCGATRCAIAFARGQFAGALQWNPLVFSGLCGVVLFDIYAAVAVSTRSRRLRLIELNAVEARIIRIATFIILAGNWTYLLLNTRKFL